MKKNIKDIFTEGAISPEKIATSIANHQSKTGIGAHDIFLGQVRADTIDGKEVTAIEFTAQREMANQVCHDIREAMFQRFNLHCMHIYHSIGTVKTGELCFFVFVSGAHRNDVFEALQVLVHEIKAKVPIFGKEIFEDATHQWKVNN
ncbi:molybdenum cofactor biosynthesis protein MoaE [Altibacter sp. HG106]|uniref:molybdenum cofactor biosynthesis protein MoaE n=1 Tax=Altibacter sp. HG106 TaxID=3023937 RepID=UPI0023501D2C|nr:molybdenum cofactor biosynthesis protein MoaE [Altibacter sp. HG106]MDC7995335.1 molybdenum cofactor biosynthesis protein MoaE [Altibacter sp. HG106]